MPSFSIALAQADDFADVLALQEQNHLSALPEESLADGFVTTQLSPETLQHMSAEQGIWVVRDADGNLAAYACANGWDFYGDGPFQRAAKAKLPAEVDGRTVRADNSFQYGPVCVAGNFRGQGVLQLVVKTIRAHYAPRFDFGITFIDIRNARSLAAHQRKLDFQQIAMLPFATVTYHMLAFPTKPRSN